MKKVKPKGKILKDEEIYKEFIQNDDDSLPISRREFIKTVGILAGTPLLGSFLSGCVSKTPEKKAAAPSPAPAPTTPAKTEAPKKEPKTYKIRVGYLPATHDSIFFSAMESGIFDELGVEVEPYIFYSGGKMGEATAAGKLDAFIVGSTAPMYYIARGAPISIVGGDAFYGSAVVTKPENVDKLNKKDINIFRGKTIATIRLGTADGIWRGYLWDAGIRDWDGGDMTTLDLGSPGDVVAAVRGDKAIGGLVWEPYVTLADLEGYPPAFWIKWLDPHSCCRTSMNDNFLKDNFETAVRFQQGIMMAEKEYYYNPDNFEEFIKQSDRWLRIGREALYKGLFYREPALDGDFRLRLGSGLAKPNTDRFATVIHKWLGWDDATTKMVQSKVDPRVNIEAAKRLGYSDKQAKLLATLNPDTREYLKTIGIKDEIIDKYFFVT